MWISEQMQLITSVCILYSLCAVSNSLPLSLSPPFPRYSAIAAKESLSGLETEMRKLEGLVKEIQGEMDYLKRRETRFQSTNGKSRPSAFRVPPLSLYLFSPLFFA
jgi:hypothetical protein